MTAAGSNTFTWDYADRMTSTTIGGTTTTFAYDGEDTRESKTTGGNTTNYLYDRESGLPLLVDDGSSAYLHEDGILAEFTGTTPEYALGDGLGSVRGVGDTSGALTGTANYNVYGSSRSSSGVSTLFRYTGEQHDSETGFTFLRARYLNPAVGRFISADTVQPNAPGTQGYNLYAYVANNPTTWVDPSGHAVQAMALPAEFVPYAQMLALIMRTPELMGALYGSCRAMGSGSPGGGLCVAVIDLVITFPVLVCGLYTPCVHQALAWAGTIGEFGSTTIAGAWQDGWAALREALNRWPRIPELPIPPIVMDAITIVPTVEEVAKCSKDYASCIINSWGGNCHACFVQCTGQRGTWPEQWCPRGEDYNEPETARAVPWTTPLQASCS